MWRLNFARLNLKTFKDLIFKLSSFNKKKIISYEHKSSLELPVYDTHLELPAHTFSTLDIYLCQMYSLSFF